MAHRFVIITAAHNEADFIARACESVIAQRIRPSRWVVVDDASQDDTASIVRRFQQAHPNLIELVRIDRPAGRDFRNKVHAFNAGMARVRGIDFEFIGNLDADISLDIDYYQQMIGAFDKEPKLGIVGGMVASCIDGVYVSQQVARDSVAGAVQLFRRECFDAIGGYLALPHGGLDAAAEIKARMSGWLVRTLPQFVVLEHRRTGSAAASPLKARAHEGRRLYSLGYSPAFFAARCIRRSMEQPRVLGSLTAMGAYALAAVRREPRALPEPVVEFLRAEQRSKLLALLRGSGAA
jgi:poly-beta-1,6-N-acetyl-D-glucosamine synthase